VQGALTKVSGVIAARVSLPNQAIVKIEKGKVTSTELTSAVKGVGFSAAAKNR
jgi:copper chaperone CopZ